MTVPKSLTYKATNILLYDALIENADRRKNNPNILSAGSDLIIIDHESAFSFLYLIGIGSYKFIDEHVFYECARKNNLLCVDFLSKLSQLSDSLLNSFIGSIPEDWRNGNDASQKIIAHIQKIRDNSGQFVERLRGAFHL